MNKTIQKPFCIAGVSGGPDSMAMLYGLCKRIVCVCHVNYRKRLSADRDQQYVTTYCKKHKIPLRILRVTPQVYKRYQHINNFQAKARAIRFDFFVKIAKQYRAKIILTAHNLNDFVETAIMQKQRKVDTLFLGIREISFYKRFVVFHPMLTFLKKELITYCDQLQIPYGIDETNFKDDYLRNRIRKVIDK
jgi:tRNA(Ile)-lysidine synthase